MKNLNIIYKYILYEFTYIYFILFFCYPSANNHGDLKSIAKLSKNGDCYECIKNLAEKTPARMSGSINNEKAIFYLKKEMESYGINTYIDSVQVPNWHPGYSKISIVNSKINLATIPLGLSIGTENKELKLKIIEIKSKKELEKVDSLNNYAVFFNEKMDTTENGYSKAGWQRMFGASMAAKKGAAAVITRSLSPVSDKFPRTGTLRYENNVSKIPAVVISTVDADFLSEKLSENPNLEIKFSSSSKYKGKTSGLNLIGEIKGSVHPERVLLITAHIDSWFNSQGAQDNATGCAQAISILKILSKAEIKPTNTIRVMIYQDEEISMSGMTKYIEKYGNQQHLFNLEIDSGAEEPVGFTLFESENKFNTIKSVMKDFPKIELQRFPMEAASFWPLSYNKKIPVYFYMAKRKNYFSIHHSEIDNISLISRENINKSCEQITSFIYLLDKISIKIRK